jgi:hypothetical protein
MASALGFKKHHPNSKASGMGRQTSVERYKDHAWSCLPPDKPLDMTCFELIEKIGTGLTSVVYLARVKTTSSKESLVVLKVRGRIIHDTSGNRWATLQQLLFHRAITISSCCADVEWSHHI